MSEQAPIVVVGGTSGIGFATAAVFSDTGVPVTILGRSKARLDEALRRLGASARGEAVDAGDRGALDLVFSRIAPIGHLVIAASGGAGAGPFGSVKADDVRLGFEAKFWLHFNGGLHLT